MKLTIPYGRAICYSGFREGQHPGGIVPSYDEIREDLVLLHDHWQYLRLYDCDEHARIVLEVIRKEQMNFQVMLGAYIIAEKNNPSCPWGGGNHFSEKELETNRAYNYNRVKQLIEMANSYPDIVCALSAGNEACVDWTDHLVPVESVLEYVRIIKSKTHIPVTFCENYVPWLDKLEPLARAVDLISIHTYPVWEYKTVFKAMDYTKQNYYSVADKYPDKPIVITEAGWTTQSNGRGIPAHHVNEHTQKSYCKELLEWADKEKIITFVFEAFDEPWKGSPDPMEPEKHWGLYKVNRTPKLILQDNFA